MRKKPSKTRSAFDAEEPGLRRALKARLDAIEPIGSAPDGADVWDRVVPIDSKLVVTELRPLVKDRLGALFPLNFVRKGGYQSVDEALEHLMPQLQTWCPASVPNRAACGSTTTGPARVGSLSNS